MRFARGMVFGMTLAIGILKADPVCAENQGKLPEIASWQNGFGYQEDGTQITGGWAYDMVNPAGRYVQFGEDGSVIQKTENPDTMDMGENYTGTELVPATLAIRAELFDGFSGTVTVLVEGSGGIQRTVELRQDNFYGLNIPVNSGDYRVIKAEARDEIHSYVTQFPAAIGAEGRFSLLFHKENRAPVAAEARFSECICSFWIGNASTVGIIQSGTDPANTGRPRQQPR